MHCPGKTMSRLVFDSPSASARLARATAWLAARTEPHVTVLGASLEAAAEVARGALVLRGGASLGWERTTLGALAAQLARPELARLDLAPASPLALEALCARIIHEQPGLLGRFAPIASRPGLPRALARTLGELRLARLVTLADPDLVRLLAAYEKELAKARLVDRAQTFALAAEVAQPCAAVVAVDVPVRTRAEERLLAALAPEHALAVIPGGDERSLALTCSAWSAETEAHVPTVDADGPLAPLYAGLFGDVTSASTAVPDHAVTVLSAPGESRECVEIARLVLAEAAKGTPLDRIAVLLRAPQYGAHVAEAFRRAAVPVFFARGTKRPDPAGRAFLALLACAAEGLSARRFAEYLSLGEIPEEGDAGAPPPAQVRSERIATPDDDTLQGLLGATAAGEHIATDDVHAEPAEPYVVDEDEVARKAGTIRTPRHWEKILVEAAVIGEADRWKNRLAGLAAKYASDVAAYEKKDEAALAEGSRRELRAAESLQRFALPLVDDLAALPHRASWGEWVDRLGAIATRALRRPDRVLAVLAELEPMASVADVSIAEVRLVLQSRLAQLLVPSLGRRYGKVFVATTEEARGLAFDVVFVPGLAEKIFPQKVVEDPLLLDQARRALASDLPTNTERTGDERLALRLAVGAARRRVVLSYPRLDVEQARPRTPSFYGLEVLRVAEGKLGDFEHLAQKAALTAEARIGWPAPAKREDAIDEAEYDLALLKDVLDRSEEDADGEGRYLLDAKDANPHLARALRFRWMRWDKELRGSDGLVGPKGAALEAIQAHGLSQRSFSPTALQNFAACPYRFLLSAVHRLAPREEPDAIEDIDPLTRGSLVHETQYSLLTRLSEQGMLPITEANLEAARGVLEVVLDETAEEFRARLHPAIPRVWKDAITGIGADLREWLRRMTLEPDWEPAHFELSFGLKDPRAQDVKSTDAPVVLENGLQLRGSIDLVERSKRGTIRAVDSKTGKVRAKKDAVIGGGEILQPVLYALALEKMFPGTLVEEGVLYYCTAAGNFEKVPVLLDDVARKAADTMAKIVGRSLEIGLLPAAPSSEKKGYSACTWCDFRPVCGPYEDIRIKKKPPEKLKHLVPLRRHR